MSDDDTAVTQLRRWQDSGGRWRVLARGTDTVTIALLSCDIGEEVDRMSSRSPALLAYLGERDSSEDDLAPASRSPPEPRVVMRDRDVSGRPRNARPAMLSAALCGRARGVSRRCIAAGTAAA